MSDENDPRRVKLGLPNKDGVHEFVFTLRQANDLIATLVNYLRSIPSKPALTGTTKVFQQPIVVDGMGISQMEGSGGTSALLVLHSGEAELQFSIPVADLFEALELLKQQTEPAPSGHRGH